MNPKYKIFVWVAMIIATAVLTNCKTGKAPSHKRYKPEEKFENIKGINVPELTLGEKVWKPSGDLKHEIKHNLPLHRIKEFYGSHEGSYREA